MLLRKMEICRVCGAMLYPNLADKHMEYHQALVDLTKAAASSAEQLAALAKSMRELAGIVKTTLPHRLSDRVKREH